MVRIVTVREVATLLQLKESTVCSLAAEGKLPGFKLGGVVGTVYCWVLISFFGAIVNKLVRRQEES